MQSSFLSINIYFDDNYFSDSFWNNTATSMTIQNEDYKIIKHISVHDSRNVFQINNKTDTKYVVNNSRSNPGWSINKWYE